MRQKKESQTNYVMSSSEMLYIYALMDFEGIGRALTIVARGYLFRGDSDLYDNVEYARNALCAWCSVPEKTKKAPEARTEPNVNFGHVSSDFPELVDEKGNGWFHRHVKNISYLNKTT